MFRAISRFITKWKTIYKLQKSGYIVTSFEYLPDVSSDNIVRIIPNDDNFNHDGDDCACKPIKRHKKLENGTELDVIQHRDMIIREK